MAQSISNPIDRPADGAFFELRDRSENQLRTIIEEIAKIKDNPEARKIENLYTSFMDEIQAEKLGLKPIQPELDAIAAIKDKSGWIREVATLQRAGVPGLFTAYVRTDSKKSDQYIVYIEQGGLGLPGELYYREPKQESIRIAYVNHIGKMLALANRPNPEKTAMRIMAMETSIAHGHWDNVRTRDADKQDLQQAYSH